VIGSIVAACGGIAFFAIGVGALIAPGLSSVQYGLPTTDRAALALIRAIGARDLVLGIIVLLLLAARNRSALELVLGVSVIAAFGDATAVWTGRRDAGPRELAVHASGAAALLVAWRLVRSGR
jgi:peptidoglycan/LPS O-acetylase OafA/YrhL